jgi:hypothetical protein
MDISLHPGPPLGTALYVPSNQSRYLEPHCYLSIVLGGPSIGPNRFCGAYIEALPRLRSFLLDLVVVSAMCWICELYYHSACGLHCGRFRLFDVDIFPRVVRERYFGRSRRNNTPIKTFFYLVLGYTALHKGSSHQCQSPRGILRGIGAKGQQVDRSDRYC